MRHLRTRVFFQLLIPILAVYFIVIVGGVRYLGNSYRLNAQQQKSASLQNIVRGIDDWLLSRVSEVIQLSRIPLNQSDAPREKLKYLMEWQDTFSYYYDFLYFIQPDGTYRATDGRSGIVSEESYLKRFFEEGALFLYAGPNTYGSIFTDHFAISTPIYNDDGSIKELLAATIPRAALQKLFGFYAFEDFDSWMMVNAQSDIITHQNPRLSGENEEDVYGRVFLRDEPWETEEVFVQIMRNGWKVVSFVSTDRLMSPFRQSYLLIGGFSIFLIIGIIVIVLILSSAVARPVRMLTDGVEKIMTGDYSQRVEIETKDELSELADSFNRLASRMTTLRTDDRFNFLGHIAARVAHELRKPLHVIQLAVQSLHSEREHRYLDIIDQEIESADRFIKEILDIAHNEELHMELYSLESLINLTAEKFRLLAGPHGINIIYKPSGVVPRQYIDVIRMEEVLSNLLQNAIDSISEADPPPEEREILIKLSRLDTKEISLEISDSGPGFDDSVIDSLFDPYFTTRSRGTGLGLSFCYRILMAHSALISLGNNENHNGVVTVLFPGKLIK